MAAFDAVFLAGVLSFFSPCILPLLPVYLAQLARGDGAQGVRADGIVTSRLNWPLIARTAVFVTGISTSFVLLGFGAGLAGLVLSSQEFLAACGIVAILLGVHQTGLFRLRMLEREKRLHLPRIFRLGIFGAFLLGFTFSFGWTPCVGPVLATVLAVASNQGQAFDAVTLMLVYSAGLAMPFLLVSLIGDRALARIRGVNRYLPQIQVASGLLIIGMGVLLMTNNLNSLSVIVSP
ncbi:MAG: cytochrome c biogenesis protein CcdA [Negativicutes bacterium]|nr:cytochrome c biogenesis protein CcdA [Negativicutes bacterium]